MKKKPKSTDSTYKLTLKIGDKTFVGEGDSVAKALQSMPHPDKIVSKATLTLEHDNKRHQQVLTPMRAKRLFYSPFFQLIQAKVLSAVTLKPIHDAA